MEKRTKLHIFAVIYKSSKLLLSKKMTGDIILLFDKKASESDDRQINDALYVSWDICILYIFTTFAAHKN